MGIGVSNVIAAIITFLLACLLDYTILWQIYEFSTNNFTGQMLVICQVGIAVLIIFITIVMPMLIATDQDNIITKAEG